MRNLLLLFCFIPWGLWAQQCLKGTVANRLFQNELMSSKESLVKGYRETFGLTTTAAQVGCVTCSLKKNPILTQKIQNLIPKECVEGALKRQIKQKSVMCKEGKAVQTTNLTGGGSPCVTSDVSGYITYVSNKVLSCFNDLELKAGQAVPLSPKTFFSKINNESGFNFSPSYKGGVGIGQLTGPAVEEMNVYKKSGKSGNGRYILDSLLNSKSSECVELKELIKDDKKNKYNNPRNPLCEWVSLTRGLPRNLIYSVGYFSYIKHSNLIEMKKRNMSMDDETLDKISLISYYRGPAKGKAYLREWKRNAPHVQQVKERLNNEIYIRAIRNKLKEVKNKAGNSCPLI